MTADEINKLAYELKVAIRFTGITKPGTVHDLIDALRDAALRTASAEPSPEVNVEARDGFYVMPYEAKPAHRLHLQIEGAIHRYVREDDALATPGSQT